MLKISITLFFLIWACYTDYKNRKVPNILSLLWLFTALIFVGYDATQRDIFSLLPVALSWAAIFVLTLIFFDGHLGGGDVKSLMTLALLFPFTAILIFFYAAVLTLAATKGKSFKNFPFMLSITGGFLLTLL